MKHKLFLPIVALSSILLLAGCGASTDSAKAPTSKPGDQTKTIAPLDADYSPSATIKLDEGNFSTYLDIPFKQGSFSIDVPQHGGGPSVTVGLDNAKNFGAGLDIPEKQPSPAEKSGDTPATGILREFQP